MKKEQDKYPTSAHLKPEKASDEGTKKADEMNVDTYPVDKKH